MTGEPGGGSALLIHLRCFGGFRVTAEQPLGPGFLEPRQVALLAIVVAAGPEGVAEERLLQLLWGDAPVNAARQALAKSLAALRRGGNGDSLISGTTSVRFNPARVDSDVAHFLAACERGDAAEVAAQYEGPFFQGVELEVGSEFAVWMTETRDRFAGQFQQVIRAARRRTATPPQGAPPPTAVPLDSTDAEGAATPSARWRWLAIAAVGIVAVAGYAAVRSTRQDGIGDAAWARGEWPTARAALTRAVSRHPARAWDWYRLARVADAEGDVIAADSAALRADSLASDLDRDQLQLIHGFRLWREGKLSSARAALDSVMQRDPKHYEASRVLGELRFRSGARMGESVVAARGSFERAVKLEPAFSDGWQRLLRIALVARDTAGAERALAGLAKAMGPGADTAYGWLRSSWTADTLPLQRELARAASTSPLILLVRLSILGFEAGRTTEALALSEPLLDRKLPATIRVRAHVLRAALFGAVGDWPRADTEAAALAAEWPWGGLMVSVATVLAPTRAESPAVLRALRDRVMRTPADSVPVEQELLPAWSRTVRLYLLGELSARLNDGRGLQAAIDSLASPKLGELTLPRRGGSYALSLQAIQLATAGDTARALARLEQAAVPVPLRAQGMLWVDGTLERRRRSLFLESVGRQAEAAGWAAASGEFPVDLLLGPPQR